MAIDPDRQIPGPPLTANERFFDALVRHQIFLLRFAGSLRNRSTQIVDETEREVRTALLGGLVVLGGSTRTNLRTADRIARDIASIRGAAWDRSASLINSELRTLARNEPDFVRMAVSRSVPVLIRTNSPTVAASRELVDTLPIQGRTVAEWLSGLKADDMQRIRDAIRNGIVQGQSVQDIVSAALGTRTNPAQGVTEIARRNIEGVIRTAVIGISNASRSQTLSLNPDVFSEELYVATLDSRTTILCASLDGNTYSIGEGPQPPVHFRCRSLRVAVIDENIVGARPFNPTTRRILLNEYTRNEGLGRVSSRDALPRGHKSAFDRFARARARELIGSVPRKVDYSVFLARQSVEFQNDVLGVTRARLFRQGNITLDKFLNRRGDELNLSQIARREPQGFVSSGLDPQDF